jgi:hypothetical protein
MDIESEDYSGYDGAKPLPTPFKLFQEDDVEEEKGMER